jgi:hypothetical protein
MTTFYYAPPQPQVRWFKQLLPLTHRIRYRDGNTGREHLRVWRQWFGHCFQIDDVAIYADAEVERRSREAIDRGDYQTFDQVLGELRARVEATKP